MLSPVAPENTRLLGAGPCRIRSQILGAPHKQKLDPKKQRTAFAIDLGPLGCVMLPMKKPEMEVSTENGSKNFYFRWQEGFVVLAPLLISPHDR